MYSYGNLQTPRISGPQTSITLIHPLDENATVNIEAIVDTGAAQTFIPETIVQQLQSQSQRQLDKTQAPSVKTATGEVKVMDAYCLRVLIVNNAGSADYDEELEVIAIPNKKYAIIGRDILNDKKTVMNCLSTPELWGFNCNAENCPIS